ncbi:katanin p80 WD40 repeat-containing subunit B1-like isoform X2 [Watersipora subatra]|uniref:katanin p80 WD40 repeat-containing subunit B1-like isoform X2 n=1 Tax=Watersipora subatra TaxID=2589382 RepID=UPI00355C976A
MSTASTKRAWRLQEFVAHGANVNCLALGHKTGRVMVTGGDDRKVNLWTIGKPNCIMSLSGHTSPVEAVRFGNAEEMVVAGSMSGALKLWDLEQAKIIRTLTGHKANIRCLDFHPYGDFVASGSLDTNVKLWDIRRKGCIFTYKGHSNGVNCLRFSPDGRWVASASEDSTIKIWDLAAGKLLVDLKQHAGPVNSMEFHPSEYLLASGSSDRSIRFWELEKFQCVDCTDYDNNAIRSVVFHPDGACIFGGSTELLKVYGWEPSRCFDSVNMSWGKVADMAVAQTQLIGASINQTTVSTFVLDLTRVAPIGEVPGTPIPPLSASGRRNFNHERPPTTSTMQQIPDQRPGVASVPRHISRQVAHKVYIDGMGSVPSSPSDTLRDILGSRSNSPTLSNQSASPDLLRKRRSHSSRGDDTRAAVRPGKKSDLRRVNSMLAMPSDRNGERVRPRLTRSSNQFLQRSQTITSPTSNVHAVRRRNRSTVNRPKRLEKTSSGAVELISMPKPAEEPEEPGPPEDPGEDATSTADVKDPTEYAEIFKGSTKVAQSPPRKILPFPAPQDDDVNKLAGDLQSASPFQPPSHSPVSDTNNRGQRAPSESVRQSGGETYRGANRAPAPSNQSNAPTSQYPPSNQPALDPKDFMPPHQPVVLGDYDALGMISKGHSSMSASLSARNKNLQLVRAMWSSGNVRTALESAVQMQDNSVIVDVLSVLNDKPTYWSLEVIDLLLLPVYKLLTSRFEDHILVAGLSLKVILKTYSPLIRQNLSPPSRLGVDITGEERHRRCMTIYKQMQEIRRLMEGKHFQKGKLENTFKEIQLLINSLDT